ncbi:O-methyltransferase family protein [Leptomonas pyrrhocoris]|uniref:O-methyltransferase family protein n=1 Tax=Leptomonas pyrrhocoris TaxID=157538 RepID=A0A0N0DV66_LEPPY|nr:O-methyltransferase family protein [Leptomonas pyrrhocoris]KPA79631.1 O-methyltransferase family protein [Leptomonas pyrrhocoris]|eukprot:XP_015658070.1 O-methyltransferase family protein [Leptomonas pyrrhocoris]
MSDTYRGFQRHPAACTAGMKREYYEYVLEFVNETPLQKELWQKALQLELPVMMAAVDEYQFFGWLCETLGVRRAVEVGVFRGVTTLALALHMPDDGVIRALDVSREYAGIGFEAWKKAGVDKKIDFIEGPAAASMQRFLDEGEAGTYDFIFIDANKEQYPEYYDLAVPLLRKGGVIVVDNTLMFGRVVEKDPSVQDTDALSKTNEMIRADKRVSAVMSIIGDGVYFARKL